MRYFIELRYNGAAYCGWQRQPNAQTVQGAIEKALSTLLRTPTEIVGAGRTDTGVHASFYIAHFDIESEQPVDVQHIKYKLNIILAEDIAIDKIYTVGDEAHARFDAREREYKYYIEPKKNPFTRATTWQYTVPLDICKMNEAAEHLLSTSDFTTFAKLNSNNKTNICDVRQAEWVEREDGVLVFTIAADRFLRNMVRSIVGTLVDVGRGKYSIEDFKRIVDSRNLSKASAGAPAQGLFLSRIDYDI